MLLLSWAFATTPGAYRAGPGLPVNMVRIRTGSTVLRKELVHETQLQARAAWRNLSVQLNLPTLSHRGRETGIGPTGLGLYRHVGQDDSRITYGLEVDLQLGPLSFTQPQYAVQQSAVAPANGWLVVLEAVTFPNSPFHVRIGLGARYPLNNGGIGTPRIEALLAGVLPVRGPFSVVGEFEVGSDDNAVALRALGRIDIKETSVDLGLQRSVFGVYSILASARMFR